MKGDILQSTQGKEWSPLSGDLSDRNDAECQTAEYLGTERAC